jgi:hypothetical protein
VQYHPEKNGFEYGLYPNTTVPYENINHSSEGITLSLYLSKFFVQDVVKRNIMNNQGKSKYTEPNQYPLIYTYPRKIGYKFEEIYIVPSSTNKNNNNNNNNNDTKNNGMNGRQEQQRQRRRSLLRTQQRQQ